MILLFPQNRIQALLAVLESDFVERWSAVADSVSSEIAVRLPRADAVATLLEARKSYVQEMAGRKFDLWLRSFDVSVDSTDGYAAAICEALQKASENTGSIATRKLYAVLFALITALRMAGWLSDSKPQPLRHSRSISAAALFLLARLMFAVELSCSETLAALIGGLKRLASCRFLLPRPRSASPCHSF